MIRCNDEILMIKNTYKHGLWTFPGGGIKRGETPRDAAIRESMEEVGIRLTNIKEIGRFSANEEYKKDTVFVFAANSTSKEAKMDKFEILEMGWFAISSLPAMSQYAKVVLEIWRNNESIKTP